MKLLKRITEISVEEANSIRGGKDCNCSCSCSCDSNDLTDSVKDSNRDWNCASVAAG